MKNTTKIIVLLLCSLAFHLWAGNTRLVMEDFDESEIITRGFSLSKQAKIRINALGAGEKSFRKRSNFNGQDGRGMIAYGWIINSKTRELVWAMTNQNTDRVGPGYNRKFKGDLELQPGVYEVYFSTLKNNLFFRKGVVSFGDLLDYIFDGSDWWDNSLNDWHITIDNVEKVLSFDEIEEMQNQFKENAVVSLTPIENSEYQEFEFNIAKKSTFKIYSIGEGYKGEMFDYSWIMDVDNREKIWEMREWHSDYAGGAVKNKKVEKEITLEKGNYVLTYVSDGSHSFESWNSNPPYDPNFWGVTLIPQNKGAKSNVKKIESKQKSSFIKFDKVRNKQFLTESFQLSKDAVISIEAYGEGSSGEMFDFGWIEDMDNNIVWEMKYYKTQHAGGASKNRMVRETIELKKGIYNLCYKTDGSHSYQSWNDDRPYKPSLWGIALYIKDGKLAAKVDNEIVQKKSKWQYKLIRIRNNQHKFRNFSLKKLSKVTIYALGEGDNKEMFDYAWIENKNTGEDVWEMLYKNTKWAGGARKNRSIKTQIYLPKGKYLLHYKSDDSHSYSSWNDRPPKDSRNYGISIKIEPVK